MIRAAFAALGRILLLLAGMAFVIAVSIFLLASYVITWPILRLSPRNQKLRATMNLASSITALVAIFGQEKATKTLADALAMADREDVKSEIDPNEIVGFEGWRNRPHTIDDDPSA